MLAGWAGWVVDYSKPAYLIADPSQLPEAIRVLRKIGLDDVRGYFDVSKVREAGLATESYETGRQRNWLTGFKQAKSASLMFARMRNGSQATSPKPTIGFLADSRTP